MKLPMFMLLTSGLLGQVVYIPNTDTATVRAMMNSNFAWLDANKALGMSGTTLPANCTAGQLFTKTNATAGSNVYVALATGTPCTTWTQQQGGGPPGATIPPTGNVLKGDGAGNALAVTGTGSNCVHVDGTSATCATGTGGATQTSDLIDCKVTVSGAVATIPTPCAISIGPVQHSLLSNATATLGGTSSSGTVYIYWDSTGTLTASEATAATLTCANCTSAALGLFPQGSFPIASVAFTANSFTTVTDLRSAYSNNVIVCGGDLACTGLSSGAVQVDAGPTVMTKAQLQSGQSTLCTDTGSANTIRCGPTPAYTGYSAGMVVQVIPVATNTGATTLSISGLAAAPVMMPDGVTALAAGQLIAGQQYPLNYDGTNFRLLAASATRVPLTTGTTVSLSGAARYYECTGACTVTLAIPSPGVQYCVRNAAGVSSVITLAALGTGAMYEKPDYSGYGTAGTGTLVSGGAAGDRVCLVGKDATHYDVWGQNGTWTAN